MTDYLDSIFGKLRETVKLTPEEREEVRQNILAARAPKNGDLDSVFGPLRAVTLSPEERDAIRRKILPVQDVPAKDAQQAGTGLYAYEKALIFDAISSFMARHPSKNSAPTIVLTPIFIGVGHGNLFRHLHPFVLQ